MKYTYKPIFIRGLFGIVFKTNAHLLLLFFYYVLFFAFLQGAIFEGQVLQHLIDISTKQARLDTFPPNYY